LESLIYFIAGIVITLIILILVRSRISFRSQKSSVYANQEPNFILEKDLSGSFVCEGVIFGPTGTVNSRFVADMIIEWDKGKGILNERFTYDTGVVQDRKWELQVSSSGDIRGTATDFVGDATGTQKGSAVNLKYCIKLPDSAGGHKLNVTDWMYKLHNGTIMNRSQFFKFGIKVAELNATIRRKEVK
jgi:hypothetical protein